MTNPPYDPTLKTLAELGPADWLPLARRRRRRVTIEDSDIGTLVSGATDKLFRVHDDPPYLMHLDSQVVRVWRIPVEQLLTGGIGTLALAPISAVSEDEVRGVIWRMQERLTQPRERKAAPEILAASYVLLGVGYSREFATALFQEVLRMKESVTYQAIIDEGRAEGRTKGRAEEAQRLLLLMGQQHLGPADDAVVAAIQAITDVERLEALAEHLLEAASWQQLLPAPAPRTRRKRSR